MRYAKVCAAAITSLPNFSFFLFVFPYNREQEKWKIKRHIKYKSTGNLQNVERNDTTEKNCHGCTFPTHYDEFGYSWLQKSDTLFLIGFRMQPTHQVIDSYLWINE